jgi:hypothetical protein
MSLWGIVVWRTVEFRHGVCIAGHSHGTAHVDDLLDQRHDLRRLHDGRGEIGRRTDLENGDLVRIALDGLDHEIRSALRLQFRRHRKAVRRRDKLRLAGRFRPAPRAEIALRIGGLWRTNTRNVVLQGIVGPAIDTHHILHTHALHGLERIRFLLDQPVVAGHDAEPEQVDLTLSHQLRGHGK